MTANNAQIRHMLAHQLRCTLGHIFVRGAMEAIATQAVFYIQLVGQAI